MTNNFDTYKYHNQNVLKIAGQLSKGMPIDRILNGIRDSVPLKLIKCIY